MRSRAVLAVLLPAVLALAVVLLWRGAAPWTDAAWWQGQRAAWSALQAARPIAFLVAFVLVFALLSALAMPGCAALALLAGPAFGTLVGTLVVGAASTLGALASFLVARHLARDAVRRRLGQRLHALDGALRRDGRLWLFWLRLVPLVPYPLINPLLGLSRLPLGEFFWPSLAGLTLGSLPYVWAGAALLDAAHGGAARVPAMFAAATLLLASAWAVRRRAARAEPGTGR